MIYKILKHSLSCLPTCHPWGGGAALGTPAESSASAALTTEKTRKSAGSQRMSLSLYPSKRQVDFIHGEMVQLYISFLQGSDFSKNVRMKKSVRTSSGGGWRVNRLILGGFYSRPNLRERHCGAKFSSPPTSVFPFPCRSPVPCRGNHRDTWSGRRL